MWAHLNGRSVGEQDRNQTGSATSGRRGPSLQRPPGNYAVSLLLQRADDERFPGTGHVLGHGQATSPGALAYLARQRELNELPEVATPSARGTQLEASLHEWRRAKKDIFAKAGKQNVAKQRTAQEEAKKAAKESAAQKPGEQPEPPAPVFDGAAAHTLLGQVPPRPQDDLDRWLNAVGVESLAAVGYDWAAGTRAIVRQVFEEYQQAALAQAQAERLVSEAATQERRLALDGTNSATWDLNATQFENVTEGQVAGMAGQAFLAKVGKPGMTANGSKKKPIPCHLDTHYHVHLNAGSSGVAFTYIVEDDYTVTPLVYDVAPTRVGNTYNWSVGGKGAHNSSARHRESHPWKGVQ